MCVLVLILFVCNNCVIMFRIAEIGVRVVRQGALPLLEKGLHKDTGLSIRLVRTLVLTHAVITLIVVDVHI